jgi:hypothetical protein
MGIPITEKLLAIAIISSLAIALELGSALGCAAGAAGVLKPCPMRVFQV